jgi:hypothetical protein
MGMYKSGLGLMEPVALQGQNVALHQPAGNVMYRYVTFYESVPPFQCIDVGAVPAQTVSARTNITNLDMPTNEFGQFRWYTIDNVQVRLFLPQAIGKSVLRNLQIAYGREVVDRDPCLHLTEFFVWQDQRPAVEMVNFMDYAVNASRIIAMGFRFHTEEIKDSGLLTAIKGNNTPCTHIWCTGNPIGT